MPKTVVTYAKVQKGKKILSKRIDSEYVTMKTRFESNRDKGGWLV